MSAKGRVKCLDKHLPSLLEQMLIWTFDERSDRKGEAFEALPVTCGHLPSLLEQMLIRTFDERSDREGEAFEALP